ncbi:KPN_02809 family neutral zinc metallopeptidase [Propionibacteriaceae bacterium Y2011]|uniref:KPN_02809 family neutral zinc metallopeptidase n=1 Tax=Microlunatus sp. Y2014 TaxID=3418488 RepID=UPI003B48609C
MRYNEGSKLDPSQVSGGGGRRRTGGIAVGGGAGIIVVILALLLGFNPDILLGGGGEQPGQPPGGEQTLQNCRTVEDIERDRNCRFVAYTNSIQEYWSENLEGYQMTKMVVFSQSISTACGQAGSEVGPFYCPADQQVYIDIEFLDKLFAQLGAEGGDAAEAYVIAHEFGHHVQNLVGTMGEVQRQGQQTGPESGAVRLELQADCFAGTWFAWAMAQPDGLISEITHEDVQRAQNAAISVGDDYIQRQSGGGVNPEGWTHGSSEQRQRWLMTGLETGDPNACDTFGGDI